MGVPAHDERDFEFAKKYGLPIRQVIEVPGRPYSLDAWAPWYADHGRCINSSPYDGLEFAAATTAIAAVKSGKLDAFFDYPKNPAKQTTKVYGVDQGIFNDGKYSSVATEILVASAQAKIGDANLAKLVQGT